MIKQNLGKLDRVLRFALAFWWLVPWAPPNNLLLVNVVIVAVGWIALAESFLDGAYCINCWALTTKINKGRLNMFNLKIKLRS